MVYHVLPRPSGRGYADFYFDCVGLQPFSRKNEISTQPKGRGNNLSRSYIERTLSKEVRHFRLTLIITKPPFGA